MNFVRTGDSLAIRAFVIVGDSHVRFYVRGNDLDDSVIKHFSKLLVVQNGNFYVDEASRQVIRVVRISVCFQVGIGNLSREAVELRFVLIGLSPKLERGFRLHFRGFYRFVCEQL